MDAMPGLMMFFTIIVSFVLLILAIFAPWYIYRIKVNTDEMLKLMELYIGKSK